jgi:predicted ATPase
MAEIYVLSGAPGTGKTSVLTKLQLTGQEVIEEAARKVKQKYSNLEQIQKSIFEIQKHQLIQKEAQYLTED